MKNMPTLREDQLKVANAVRDAFREGFQCPLVVASTGWGKTFFFSYITQGAAARNNPVLITAHRKELIRQISLSLAKFGVEHQVIAPPNLVRKIKIAHFRAYGRSFVNADSPAMVGSVQTIVGRFEQIDATLARYPGRLIIVMDEGHHVVEANIWGRVMTRYHVERNGRGLIVTATPERTDGTGLGKGHGGYADVLIEAPPMEWLFENLILSRYRVFTTANPINTAGIHSRMGEYVASELEERSNRPSITGDAINEWRQHALGMRTVCFCVSVSHSKHVAAAFCAAGIPAAHIDGEIEDDERDQAIMDFAAGKIQVLCNVNLVSEGFDLASIAGTDVTIDCVADLSPTQSIITFMQRGGRMLRYALGKVGVYLDLAGNFLRHGMLEADREWSLEGRKKRERKAANDNTPDVSIRTCTFCYSIFSPQQAVAAGRKKAAEHGEEYAGPCCPSCEKDIPVQERKVEELDGELVELTEEAKEALRRQQRQAQAKAQTADDLVRTLGYSRGRAEKIVQAREEKAQLQRQAAQALADWHARWRLPVKTVFGVYSADIKTMKPKALRKLLEDIQADDEKRGGGFSIAPAA